MLKFKKLSVGTVLAAILTMSYLSASGWTGPNYAKHWESGLGIGLYHNGEVQVQPSYIDGGYHYAQGIMTFENGADGYVVVRTAMGTSKNDARKLIKTHKYRDRWTLEPVPAVRWSASKVAVPAGANYWPV